MDEINRIERGLGDMNSKLKNDITDKLFEAILSLESIEECYRFFEDLGTVSEIHSFAQRLEVAKLLQDGLKYNEIIDRTGASAATISRVKKSLLYGADGYKLVLDRIKG